MNSVLDFPKNITCEKLSSSHMVDIGEHDIGTSIKSAPTACQSSTSTHPLNLIVKLTLGSDS